MSSYNSLALHQASPVCPRSLHRACDLSGDLYHLACPTQASGQADLKQAPAYLMSSPVPSPKLLPCWRKPQPPLMRPSTNSTHLPSTGHSCSSTGLSFSSCQMGYKSLGFLEGMGAGTDSAANSSRISCGHACAHVYMYMHACKTYCSVTVCMRYLI